MSNLLGLGDMTLRMIEYFLVLKPVEREITREEGRGRENESWGGMGCSAFAFWDKLSGKI